MNHLDISLLGPFRVTLDGTPVTHFGADTARALLAYLAMNTQSPCRREILAGLLWPDQPEPEARHNLRTALNRLRHAIRDHTPSGAKVSAHTDRGAPFLLSTRQTIQFNPQSDHWLDVAAFDDLLAGCETHAHDGLQACPSCVERLQEAVELYQGDLLSSFSLPSALFEEWLVVERERRHHQVLDALHRLTAHHIENGTYGQAQQYARRQLELEPWREIAHRQLMVALSTSGQRAAALRQYEECERVLRAELDIVPAEETTQLYQAIKENRETTVAGLLQGKYRFERKLGQGAFGQVWLATDTVLDRDVAIKYLKIGHDLIDKGMFHGEARMLARFNHPNIVQIHDAFFDQTGDRLCVVMECGGKDLGELLTGHPLPFDIILEVATGILRALSHAHGQGVVHRDVKPSNVMIGEDVKLTDFGMANLTSILQWGSSVMAGTLAYMAPEQIEGQPTDGRADLYSLGVMLYQMITGGRLPFEYTDEQTLLDAHLDETPPALTRFAPDVPPALEQIVMRLLAKDPEDRYPCADAALGALEAIQVTPKFSNLPVSLTPFVGREEEMAAVAACLDDPDCRLLTLVGPGGIGKTRLAIEVASAQGGAFEHGVCFVPLLPLQSIDGIVHAIALALNLSFGRKSDPWQQLLGYLRQKNVLLVMDNYEHLISPPRSAVAPAGGETEGTHLATNILKAAPGVKILATSRQRLNVQGEHLYPVAGMDVPEALLAAGEASMSSSAVRLFLHSARRARPDFEPADEDLAEVGRICRLVEGLPLAIELAAGWMQIMEPKEIADEMEHNLDVLETDLRDVPERQRSIRTVFDHSWSLLTERERAVMQALSVLVGRHI